MKLIDTTNLEPEAISILNKGTTGAPEPGDLWMLRLDDKDLGLVLLGYVQDTYVSALPVTMDATIACIGAATVPAELSPLNADLVVWATAPNSIGSHLLSHRVGAICSESDVRRLIHAADGEEIEPPFPLSFRGLTEELFPEVEYIFNAFAWMADDLWVSRQPGEAPFDTDILGGANLTPRTLGEWLDVPLRTALPLFHGDRLPSADEVSVVSKRIGVAASELLKPMHGYEAAALSQPALKKQIEQLGRKRRIGENAARNLALRDSYALAARQPNADEMEMARQRAINSLDRLLGED